MTTKTDRRWHPRYQSKPRMETDILRIVSVSGGKDSTATLLLALETNWQADVRAVFADTGNEHELTLEYLDYLEQATGIRIERVMADCSQRMAAKREKLLQIASGVPESEIYGKRQFSAQWTPARAARAAELMQPTGNVFLDMCLLRGGFPSRKRQFCTELLKIDPVDLYLSRLISRGYRLEQWVGVRGDESGPRAKLPDYEWGPIISVRRPILRWGVDRVFEQHRRHGVTPNPLYSLGCKRVGCMPCVNSGKDDISNMAARFPDHVEKVRALEALVSECSRGTTSATFFHVSTLQGKRGIDAAVTWSHTSHGGRQHDFLRAAEPTQCSSLYGLCE